MPSPKQTGAATWGDEGCGIRTGYSTPHLPEDKLGLASPGPHDSPKLRLLTHKAAKLTGVPAVSPAGGKVASGPDRQRLLEASAGENLRGPGCFRPTPENTVSSFLLENEQTTLQRRRRTWWKQQSGSGSWLHPHPGNSLSLTVPQ